MHNFQLTFVCLALFTFSSSFGYHSEPPPHTKPKHSTRPSPTTTMTTDSTSTSLMTTYSTPSETQSKSTSDASTEESTQTSDFTESSTGNFSTTTEIISKENKTPKQKTLLFCIFGTAISLAILVALIYCIRRHHGSYSVQEQCKPFESTVYFHNIKIILSK
ncbi:uncharacterized protein LOC117135645 [Drosophila mauritiana]|uniref:Uncharacterized protein LOC117135645 n=1 Tax=Drosophila mauritiana TaxID=7226 RepID=A0A6P8J933_DROMA|nr:uncharacterized protein LOC117135645 [Drosophila mauritiana]